MPDEEAFSLLVRLMHSYDLRGHFLPEMPKLQLRLVRRGQYTIANFIHTYSVLVPGMLFSWTPLPNISSDCSSID